MTVKRTIKTISISLLLLATMTTANAQDLLARQAPVDRRMRTVDTLVLKNIQERENVTSPAAELYDSWDDAYAHKTAGNMPDKLTISLRHFCMPTNSRVITSNFGARWGRQHKGLDVKVYIGDTIRAAFNGKVRVVRYEARGYGNYIVIRHQNGLETIYGHLSKQLVSEDQIVKAGDPIGLGGNTGRSTGSHLHFETRLCGVALNPAIMFDFRNQDVTGDFYTFRRKTYARESTQANRLRGVNGTALAANTNDSNDDELYSREANQRNNSNRSSAARTRMHKVKSGESLYSTARKRNTTVDAICRLNGISKSTKLRPGQILKYNSAPIALPR